jgi:hypothetical protein
MYPFGSSWHSVTNNIRTGVVSQRLYVWPEPGADVRTSKVASRKKDTRHFTGRELRVCAFDKRNLEFRIVQIKCRTSTSI